jgi:hypothetical protein
MSDALDGLSNYYSIQANIDALKNAQLNSTSALSSNNNSSNSISSDPKSFLLQTEQNFNQMLNILITSPDDQNQQSSSTNPLDSLLSNQSSTQTDVTGIQQLQTLEQNSPLIGKTVSYLDSASNAEISAVINSINFSSNLSPTLILNNGAVISPGAVTAIK